MLGVHKDAACAVVKGMALDVKAAEDVVAGGDVRHLRPDGQDEPLLFECVELAVGGKKDGSDFVRTRLGGKEHPVSERADDAFDGGVAEGCHSFFFLELSGWRTMGGAARFGCILG